ncbi:MAG: type II toxin-antitoxin system VapC family toxin [Bifidobacteriaceae bacterium]|jgi:predicted nucleic acid-binding protein|nr:type II toxin-antitoxin system VapC family toxin [Bifidobacteriaceae bacterium]
MPKYYLDTSALVKLIRTEAGSSQMRAVWDDPDNIFLTNILGKVEFLRAVGTDGPRATIRARTALTSMDLMAVDDSTAEVAAGLDPAVMRALDALHVASAMTLGPSLDAIITYDARMADAARLAGIKVLAPG